MIKIGILGDIGSGKSYVARNFGYQVFNADKEVTKLYNNDRKIFNKLNKILPQHIKSFPVSKVEVSNAILAKENNLNKIIKIVHTEITKKMNLFLKKNKNSKIVILDIPLLLENKINNKDDILVYVQASKLNILKRLKKRKNFNKELIKKFRAVQLPISYKKEKSHFIIKNNFTKKSVKNGIKSILRQIR